MPTTPPTSLTIDTASICEYFTSGPLSLARQRTARANLAIRIDCQVGDATLTGSSECVIRADSAAERARALRYVERGLGHLVGTTATVDASASDLSTALAPLVQGLHLPEHGALSPMNQRRANLGLESALLELVAASGRLGAEPPHPAQTATTDAAAASTAPVTYLRSTGDLSTDRQVLKQTGPLTGTYILDLPHPTPEDELDRHVAALSRLLKGQPKARIVLDCRMRVRDLDRVEALQAIADDARTGWFTRRTGEVLIMAGYGVRTLERLRALTTRNIRAVHLRPTHVGSLLGLNRLATQARTDKPGLFIAMSAPGGGSQLSAVPCQRAAVLTSAVDVFLPSLEPAASSAAVADDSGRSGTGAQPTPVRIRYDELVPLAGTYAHLSAADATDSVAPHVYSDEADSLGLSHDALRSSLVQRSAIAHSFRTTRYSSTTFTATEGADGPALLFGASARSPVSSHSAYVIADGHKGAAQALLERAGAPVPQGRIFGIADTAGALAYARRVGYPLVTKPASGTGGTGVTLNIQDEAQLRAAFETIRGYPRYANGDVLIQRHVPGDIYRIVVGDQRVLAAIRRRRPLVVGDGRRTIAELVIATNSPRRLNPRLRNAPITIEAAAAFLEHHDRTVHDVPRPGEQVYLGTNADGAMRGDSLDVSDELHPSIAAAMVKAVSAIPGLRFCGVDVLIEDHRRPLDEQQVGICELNSCPELTTPEFPVYGSGSAAADVVFQGAAQRRGVRTGDSTTTPRVRLSASDVSHPDRFVAWLTKLAAARGVQLDALEQQGRGVQAHLAGSLVAVTSLASLAIRGPQRTTVGRVETSPLPGTVETPAGESA
ncbi:MAG TPA: hypothetical protein H9815_12950 [Candidatus Ruania gallistercoris]|uniref:ATP-grasp domain-containing protein n=1 Tax=Candidatus Ruania gallistercoris TaxID=2838746 RepID=A0A9D2EFF2_9MICO|nr:hypothetical protein [Candidatus Ruania gallistercoris]